MSQFEAFKKLYSNLPSWAFEENLTGEKVSDRFYDEEMNRLEVEAFYGMKVESLITRLAQRQDEYMNLYDLYKNSAKVLQNLYDKTQPPTSK